MKRAGSTKKVNEENAPSSKYAATVDDCSPATNEAAAIQQRKLRYTNGKKNIDMIGKDKVVYEGVSDSTSVIIRDLRRSGSFKAFGMHQQETIQHVCNAIMKLAAVKTTKLLKLAKYKSMIERFTSLAKQMLDGKLLESYNIELTKVDAAKVQSIRIPLTGDDSIVISLVIRDNYAQFKLANCKEDRVVTSVYLFVSEIITLVKYLSERFSLGLMQSKLSMPSTLFVNTESDDFFM